MKLLTGSIVFVVVICAGFAAYFAAYGLYHIVRMVGRMI